MKQLFTFLGFLILISCSNYGQLTTLTKLSKKLKENSGLAITKSENLWFIEDSGNKNNIYKVANDGDIKTSIEITNAQNVDWEELTSDNKGNIYIGDFGNNANKRDNLAIYIISNPDDIKSDKTKAQKITFHYEDQQDFPPKKDELFYDCEAFFYLNNNLYLFTKDRSHPYQGMCNMYRIPAQPGDYEAKLIDSYHFGDTYTIGSITAADISPDKSTIALLTHKHVYLFSNYSGNNFFSGKLTTINMNNNSQKESIAFKDQHTLLISDEASKKKHPKLYELKIP
ncbi:hypothetical protein NBRC110019_04830 [Neptunitalea chrysea]|uniref:SdiA-regulated n=1 Tax=Neptunitalea chrysea TaxID=1647581 RepID=A0A9W6B312_9FLAO|nr:hypothetical protein [Neptunitalea chrysea]GLB51444.1 hypothetical protein NBRC110019_04830 [Neptunitalea chrysea]